MGFIQNKPWTTQQGLMGNPPTEDLDGQLRRGQNLIMETVFSWHCKEGVPKPKMANKVQELKQKPQMRILQNF